MSAGHRAWALRGERMEPSLGRVKLLIADHDPLARRAVRETLGKREDVILIGEAAGTAEAVASCMRQAPDIVLLDTELPPHGGLDATRHILVVAPLARVVLFAVQEREELALGGLEAGAAGFLSKDIDMSALARALRGVLQGEAAVSRRLALQTIVRLRGVTGQMRGMRPMSGPLTDRQWQVVELLADGRTALEMAQILDVSVHTVRSHIRLLLRTLGARTPAEAVLAAELLRGRGTAVTHAFG
jgi:DNA-binding NarL/FixJ family response regulator